MNKSIFLIIVTILLTGCANSVWVHQKDKVQNQEQVQDKDQYSKTKGIPFYVKVERFQQETKWEQTWIETTLKVEKTYLSDDPEAKKPIIIQEFTKHFTKDQLPQLASLKKEILTLSQGNDETAKKIINDFIAVPGINDTSSAKSVLTSNTLKSMWVVDGSKTYYLNAPLPWFGTNTLSHELNGDGTLSNASSAPNTKLAEGISNLIPIKEYFTGKFVTPLTNESNKSRSETLRLMSTIEKNFSAEEAEANKATSSFVYNISINFEETGYVYTFSKQFDSQPTTAAPIQFDTTNGLFVREQITTQNAAPKKDTDAKSIGFQGSITLPKENVKQ